MILEVGKLFTVILSMRGLISISSTFPFSSTKVAVDFCCAGLKAFCRHFPGVRLLTLQGSCELTPAMLSPVVAEMRLMAVAPGACRAGAVAEDWLHSLGL